MPFSFKSHRISSALYCCCCIPPNFRHSAILVIIHILVDNTAMAEYGSKSTLASVVLCLILWCDQSCSWSVSSAGDIPSIDSVQVVGYKKFTPMNTADLYVNLTVGLSGRGLDERLQIRPTSKIALRGSECYKNHRAKNIDSENLVFTEVN